MMPCWPPDFSIDAQRPVSLLRPLSVASIGRGVRLTCPQLSIPTAVEGACWIRMSPLTTDHRSSRHGPQGDERDYHLLSPHPAPPSRSPRSCATRRRLLDGGSRLRVRFAVALGAALVRGPRCQARALQQSPHEQRAAAQLHASSRPSPQQVQATVSMKRTPSRSTAVTAGRPSASASRYRMVSASMLPSSRRTCRRPGCKSTSTRSIASPCCHYP